MCKKDTYHALGWHQDWVRSLWLYRASSSFSLFCFPPLSPRDDFTKIKSELRGPKEASSIIAGNSSLFFAHNNDEKQLQLLSTRAMSCLSIVKKKQFDWVTKHCQVNHKSKLSPNSKLLWLFMISIPLKMKSSTVKTKVWPRCWLNRLGFEADWWEQILTSAILDSCYHHQCP